MKPLAWSSRLLAVAATKISPPGLEATRARGGQATRPQDKPVDGPCGVRNLTTAPRPMPPA